jgi:hypothetical protein
VTREAPLIVVYSEAGTHRVRYGTGFASQFMPALMRNPGSILLA